jgi:hypothetical protein
MKRFLFCIAAIVLFQTRDLAQSYGLIFSSHEVVQEKRTSLDLAPDDSLCFNHNFDLSFDLSFLPRHQIYFGYIFRIIAAGKDGNDQNIDLIYNQRLYNFKIIVGENFSGISFSVDSSKLYHDWNTFALHYDLDKHLLQCSVNGRAIGSAVIPTTAGCFKFLWGANDFGKFRTRDIPPMQLKDIKLSGDGTLRYNWPLDESTGEMALDRLTHRAARIKNAIWLKPKYQLWDPIGSFTIRGYAGAAYDPVQDKLFVLGSDSIAAYTLTRDGFSLDWTPTHPATLLLGHQSIYDTLNKRLLDIFIDRKLVNAFSFGTRQWDQSLSYGPLTEYWHANKFISPGDSSLYVVGGYGQLHYKNLVQRYHFGTRQWDTVNTTGDTLPPRYLSALGVDAQGKYAYIVGGYGSRTGDQMLDPRNYYDLFRFDIKKHSFRKSFSLRPLTYPFAFANSLVLTAKPNAWYGLLFPNDSYNSALQLVEGSLTDSTFRLVGNTIPYSFHDIQSFADLYYSPLSNKLIAVTLFTTTEQDKERSTQVRVYTLNYPPEPTDIVRASLPATPARRGSWMLITLLAAIAVAVTWVIFRIRAMRRLKPASAPHIAAAGMPAVTAAVTPVTGTMTGPTAFGNGFAATTAAPLSLAGDGHTLAHEAGPQASAIYLFGPFQAFDRDGHDCTRLFTPLLKELFLIITAYTIRNGRGISSEGLNETLWHDKAEKDAKNNRSVNLAKLKPILEKIGSCSITKESGYWQVQSLDDTYIDYKKAVILLQETTVPDSQHIHALVHIIKRGPFLFQTEYNWLDDIKSEVSNAVIDRCLSYLRHHDITENPEFTIEIANCIFFFDQLNEDALTFKCKSLILLKRHNLASNTYLKFVKDYKDIYSAEFDKSFQEIIA